MEEVAANLHRLGKTRTSETYRSTLNSFRRFRNGMDIPLDKISPGVTAEYEAWLRACGLSSNSSSFYMRNLRAVYNRAVDQGLTVQRSPFRHVYTGVGKTVKRALPLKDIQSLKHLDLSENPVMAFSRDMFMFSFYTRGMSFVDMAYLRKSDLNCGILSYRRRKTGQVLHIKWEKCMQEIVSRHMTAESEYLLPIIRPGGNSGRRQYLSTGQLINRQLHSIGSILGLPIPLTMYVARHSWASIAKSKNIPISVISEGMGHDSESTTRIYLASLDTALIDRANRLILNSL